MVFDDFEKDHFNNAIYNLSIMNLNIICNNRALNSIAPFYSNCEIVLTFNTRQHLAKCNSIKQPLRISTDRLSFPDRKTSEKLWKIPQTHENPLY